MDGIPFGSAPSKPGAHTVSAGTSRGEPCFETTPHGVFLKIALPFLDGKGKPRGSQPPEQVPRAALTSGPLQI